MARFEAFWEVACDYTHYMWLGVMVSIFLFILAVFSVLLAPPGTTSYAIAVIDLVMVLVLGTSLGGMFLICRRRVEEY